MVSGWLNESIDALNCFDMLNIDCSKEEAYDYTIYIEKMGISKQLNSLYLEMYEFVDEYILKII